MENIKAGDRFLYKFGWFGSAHGGFLGLENYSCILTVVEDNGVMWFKDGGLWFGEVYPIEEKFFSKLVKL